MSDFSCSLLIVTHERSALLRNLLSSVQRVAPASFERVVIVDDSSQPDPVEDEYPTLPIRYRWSSGRLFVSRAKNAALKESQSEYVFFIDDDNQLTETTLHAARTLSGNSGIGAVMPSVLYLRNPNLVWVYATPFLPGRWEFDLVGRNRPREARLEGQLRTTDALPNAACFRREALGSANGFDERLPVNSSADLCQRLVGRGWRVVADTGAFTLHDVELPGTPGYWVQHSAADPARSYFESRDWFISRRRFHSGERWVRPRAMWHASRFLLPKLAGLAIRRQSGAWTVAQQTVRGAAAGLQDRFE